MSTGLHADTRVDVDVDLGLPVPCAWEDGCFDEAVWKGFQPCCKFTANLCDKHKEKTIVDVEWMKARARSYGRNVTCNLCGADPLPDYLWSEL